MDHPAVVRGSTAFPTSLLGPVVSIGNFDGVHRGHRVLLDRTLELAAELHRPACVYTFHPAPRDVLRPNNTVSRIQRLNDRVDCLLELGIATVVVEPFDLSFGRRDARWFAQEVLSARLRAAAVVVGWDFRFGRGRTGGVDELARWLDVPVEQVQGHTDAGGIVSSSRIRQAIHGGEVAEAAGLLGRPHVVYGKVVQGDQRGRTIGFPTANVQPETPLIPANGVYAVNARVAGGPRLPAVCNIGTKPTFGQNARSLEVHVLDFEGDLYDQMLGVEFVERLRGEQAFDGVPQLVHQIGLDVVRARERLGGSGGDAG